MPKVIKDIDKKILTTAEELFKEKGYENVDMRFIAKTTGIAVGTLYNYYKNKFDLFSIVLENSWNRTLKKCEEIEDEKVNYDEKLIKILSTIYEDIINRKGMGSQFMRELHKRDKEKETNEKMKNFGQKNSEIIKRVILKGIKAGVFKEEEEFIEHMAYDLLMLCVHLRNKYEKEDAIKYIKYRVKRMC
ncbi:TetR/AcrR family transcriptional regulator [Anaeromicrobium sediminis]|uniref:HTH tetR-type domain-containing protein n=1 Tax=Anaeromicrobium sediminis TaxID=1478221 RepID=A0A267MDM1_9FIRM|nr:TetR/AcrR family transcriptional regulator [Anaeromicrobium sediminis]PAB56903.1 hypothetical protein CCE28_20020 [Anaeromicrobium sediminis]